MTLSEFRVLEHRLDGSAELQRFLSDLPLSKAVARDKPAGKGREMRMNGLWFRKGLGMAADQRVDLQLRGSRHRVHTPPSLCILLAVRAPLLADLLVPRLSR